MYGYRCRSVSMDEGMDYADASAKSEAKPAPDESSFAWTVERVLESRTRLNSYWVVGADWLPLPRAAARDLFDLLDKTKTKWYKQQMLFTRMPLTRGFSTALDELPIELTLETESGRAVVAAILESVLCEIVTDEIVTRSVEFLTCFLPTVHASAQRIGMDGTAVLLRAIASPRREICDQELRYVYDMMPSMHTALRVFRGYPR